MGHSQTIHCIGEGKERKNENGTITRRLYYAMSRLEIKQENIKAIRNEEKIVLWYAQTKTGCKILETYQPSELKPSNQIKDVKTVTCPRCQGVGCQICNRAGITTKKHLSGYLDWQLKPD